MRLYRNARDLQHWFVHDDTIGWFRFPARIDGWADRQPLRTINEPDLREVPLRLSFNTGLPIATRRLRHAA
jgi:hypothetical protein